MECPICFDVLPINSITIFSCGHCFCLECVESQCKISENNQCPCCRQNSQIYKGALTRNRRKQLQVSLDHYYVKQALLTLPTPSFTVPKLLEDLLQFDDDLNLKLVRGIFWEYYTLIIPFFGLFYEEPYLMYKKKVMMDLFSVINTYELYLDHKECKQFFDTYQSIRN